MESTLRSMEEICELLAYIGGTVGRDLERDAYLSCVVKHLQLSHGAGVRLERLVRYEMPQLARLAIDSS
jgi:hypothetical protein